MNATPIALILVTLMLVLCILAIVIDWVIKRRYPERLVEPDRSTLRSPEVDARWETDSGRQRTP